MSDQLYRLDRNQDDGLMGAIDNAGTFTTLERAALFDAVKAFMVPVEPDYEAAAERLSLDGPVDDADRVWVREIVDAALKGDN